MPRTRSGTVGASCSAAKNASADAATHASNTHVFSFGSNSAAQLSRRLNVDVSDFKATPARLDDHVRIFAGASQTWGGGAVASIHPLAGQRVFGSLFRLSEAQLEILDGYEGVQYGVYRRVQKEAISAKGERIACIAYVRSDTTYERAPDVRYLRAIRVMLDERKPARKSKILIGAVIRGKVVSLGHFWLDRLVMTAGARA